MVARLAASSSAAKDGDVTVTRPLGTGDGDLLVAIIWSDPGATSTDITAPSGWAISGAAGTSAGSIQGWVYTKTAADEPVSQTWDLNNGTANAVHVLRVTGASGVEVVPSWGGSAAGSTTHDAPSISPATSSALLVCGVYAVTALNAATFTAPTGMTEATDQAPADFTPGWAYSSVAYQQLATSGATGVKTFTSSFTSSGADGGSMTVSLAIQAATPTAFPAGLLPIRAELLLGSAWVDVTSFVRYSDGIQIRRGRSGEGRQTDPTTVGLTFDNRGGLFSPRNPTSQFYGLVKRNTQGRISVTTPTTWLALDGVGSASAPDTAGLSVTGDIDIRCDLALHTWAEPLKYVMLKYGSAGNRSYQLFTGDGGALTFYWSNDGTTENTATSTSVVPQPLLGRKRIRVTLDVNNGAAGRTITFYVADPSDGTLSTTTWTQLGDPVVQAGTTSIFDSTASLFAFTNSAARYYALQVHNGIGGAAVASPDFAAQNAGVSRFADAQGNTWSVNNGAAVTDADIRVSVEIPAWPRKRDQSGLDATVPVEGAGIMRRLGTGASPLNSALRRGVTSGQTDGLIEYWPCEDEDGATRLASAVGGPAMVMNNAAADLAAFSGFTCSLPLPTLAAATELRGAVRNHVPTGEYALRFLIAVPDAGTTDGASLLEYNFTGTASTWQLRYGTGGTVTVRAFADSGTSLLNAGPFGYTLDGALARFGLELTQNGADIDWAIRALEPGAELGFVNSGTVAGQTFGRVTRVTGSPGGGTDGVTLGHFTVQTEIESQYELKDELNAWAGETAGRRVERLCSEEDIGFRAVADLDDTAAMGPQGARSLLDLLRECEEADGGVLYEPRDTFGLAYRPRSSMYSLPPSLELDHAQNQLAAPLDPVTDDSTSANDVTAARADGASSRQVLEAGPMSVADIGRYDTSVTLNVASDTTLDDHAGWRLHLGTVDEDRYPSIQVRLAHPEFTGDAALTADVRALDVGDRLLVTNPPAGEPPEDVDQLAQGFTERLDQKTHDIAVNAAPARPWRVGIYDDTAAAGYRYASDTTTAEALDTTETGVDVTVAAGEKGWSVADGSFGIMVGGERMTVTGVSGTAPSQTFTVTRSVNGVVKSHVAGVKVELFEPSYWGL